MNADQSRLSYYTGSEIKAINAAFDRIQWLADSYEMAAPQRLREALSYERRGMSNITCAKACIVREFWNGMNPAMDERFSSAMPDKLYDLSAGLLFAHVFGARMGAKYLQSTLHADQAGAGRFRDLVKEFISLVGAALLAHDASLERRS